MKKHLISILAISLMLLVVGVLPVRALLGAWYEHMFVVNVYEESDGYSAKMVNNIADGVTWGANIATYTDGPPVTLAMGWNSFSGTEYCGSTPTQNHPGDPRYVSAQETADTIYLTKIGCEGQRYGRSNGKHIISSPGGTNYYDNWYHQEALP
jgi:hypothetical protein